MKLQLFLTPIVLFGLIAGILNADTTMEAIIWPMIGIAGLLGVATLGMSSSQVAEKIKSAF
ncbi:hypothetical protein [Salinicoccus halitifaciens]|uniref:Uncharacterized membrane protein YuzA (DUF378 family) n=1 Tax=Salinicoccus halitifaciens TaxID=1073415 RepID=A0ABV2E8Y8_9STAP|nr:hypothetical protein [Salinicoccus halitifaciens]MCD2138001.1 hypothetical protein [Salinicoccus halitifaciens]